MSLPSVDRSLEHALKAVIWALGSAGSAVASFMERSLPQMQWIAALAAIIAAIVSIYCTYKATRKPPKL